MYFIEKQDRLQDYAMRKVCCVRRDHSRTKEEPEDRGPITQS